MPEQWTRKKMVFFVPKEYNIPKEGPIEPLKKKDEEKKEEKKK